MDITKIEAGSLVDVFLDSGTTIRVQTASAPWQQEDGAWMVKLQTNGVPKSGYLLNKCIPAVDFLEIPGKYTYIVIKLLRGALKKADLDPETEVALKELCDGYVKKFLKK